VPALKITSPPRKVGLDRRAVRHLSGGLVRLGLIGGAPRIFGFPEDDLATRLYSRRPVLASIREIPSPSTPPERLKSIGGSKSDDWNSILANQTLSLLWLGNSKNETKDT
jgi:hypothetical protein